MVSRYRQLGCAYRLCDSRLKATPLFLRRLRVGSRADGSWSRDAFGSRLPRWRMECWKRHRLWCRRCTAPRRHGDRAFGIPRSTTRASRTNFGLLPSTHRFRPHSALESCVVDSCPRRTPPADYFAASALLAIPNLLYIYIEDTSTLALVCLALDHEQALAGLGVTI